MTGYEKKNYFSLEMAKDNDRIKICAFEKISDDEKTIRHYEFLEISSKEIERLCAVMANLLNRANHYGKINKATLKELQTTGQLLYDSLLTCSVKEKLSSTKVRDLMVNIDDNLVQIPWELLFDGDSFLCRKFNMGRIVRTGQKSSEAIVRKISKPLKILIIADPKGDLEASYYEGEKLKSELVKKKKLVEVQMRSSDVNVNFLKGALREFDVVHYAGHADYDVKNPSNSGFLMADGKLKAADVMKMIGSKPLPSLVLSNACRSGHTDIWKVGKDYESEIFGLANAFLLAGVRHYIGTFWDVQDEPSFYFALEFYKELINGESVGEAVRKARQKLIDIYGDEAVIWASYMLYGDPTFRYIDCKKKEDSYNHGDAPHNDDKIPDEKNRRRWRGDNEDIPVMPKPLLRKKNPLKALVLIPLSIVVALFIYFPLRQDNRTEQYMAEDSIPTVVAVHESAEKKKRRIDELVASLIKNYKDGQTTIEKEAPDLWRSRPLTLVFLNIKTVGISQLDKEYILSGVINSLHHSNRVQVVEREILDKLLEELKISSSDLANPATTLKIGNILSARLIATGSIVEHSGNWQINLRIIETETTLIKAAITDSFDTKEKQKVAANLGREIMKRLRTEYPLQGKIISIDKKRAVIDIGSNEGVTEGLKLNLLSETLPTEKLGELRVTSVEKEKALAVLASKYIDFKAPQSASLHKTSKQLPVISKDLPPNTSSSYLKENLRVQERL